MKSKKGAIAVGTLVLIVMGIILLFGAGGVIKFLLTDKTPLIIGGIFIMLLVLSRRKRK